MLKTTRRVIKTFFTLSLLFIFKNNPKKFLKKISKKRKQLTNVIPCFQNQRIALN